MGLPLSFYHLFGLFLPQGDDKAENLTPPEIRPRGPLIWLHVPQEDDHQVVIDLIYRLLEIRPETWFLITGRQATKTEFPDQCITATLPRDDRLSAANFVAHWQPDVMVWMSGSLNPALIAEAKTSGIPLYLVDTGNAFAASKDLGWWPRLRYRTLQLFDGIIVGDPATEAALRGAGAQWENIEITGVLEKDVDALPCNQAERDLYAELLDLRPVWLAAGINLVELDSVLSAHRQVIRRSHRLLLILVPANPDDGGAFADIIEPQDFDFSQLSTGGEPDAHTQIFLADSDEDYGLWYRLAPVSFIGQTMANWSESGPDPFDAAALGSAVLHGPWLAPHQKAFHRLARAGASQQVSHAGELAQAVETLLEPDRTAEMAHAAWQISSAGAEVVERVVALLDQALSRRAKQS